MKIIISEKAKKKKKDKKFIENYWKTIYPDEYVDVLVNEDEFFEKLKTASRKKQSTFVGTLKKTKDNFVYLDISNNIINGLYSMLPDEDAEKPPYNNKGFNSVGAHISVIGTDEYKSARIEKIDEIGKEFAFKSGKIYSVNPDGWDDMSEVWFMDVESKELEELRKKYKLPRLIDNHNFHISFAVKRK